MEAIAIRMEAIVVRIQADESIDQFMALLRAAANCLRL